MATRSQISKNEEIINLCKAIGLDYSKSYSDGLENKDLRYGKIMLMCDQVYLHSYVVPVSSSNYRLC